MGNILQSASKVVFILVAVAACAALFVGKIEAKDFMTLAAMTFTYYFAAYKSSPPPPDDTAGTAK